MGVLDPFWGEKGYVAPAEFRPNPARAVHAFCHCLPDLWHQMSVHLSAASCIDWAARLTGMSEPAVKVAVHRGLKALAARIRDAG